MASDFRHKVTALKAVKKTGKFITLQRITYTKMKKNNTYKKKEKRSYTYFGCVAGVYFFIKADGNLKGLNLGQEFANSPKYHCRNKTGLNTGSGYAFEDLFFQTCKSNGMDITQVEVMENGADFIVNGVPVQLKYGRSPKSVFKALFDKRTGEYRYSGQTIITNKENETTLRDLIEQNKDRLNGENIVVNPLGTPQISQKEVEEQLHRGIASAKIDAKNILTDSNAQTNIVFGMVVSFCAVIGIGAIHQYNELSTTEGNREHKIKKVAKAVENSLKKNWLKGTVVSAITAVVFFGGHLINRQLKRPN